MRQTHLTVWHMSFSSRFFLEHFLLTPEITRVMLSRFSFLLNWERKLNLGHAFLMADFTIKSLHFFLANCSSMNISVRLIEFTCKCYAFYIFDALSFQKVCNWKNKVHNLAAMGENLTVASEQKRLRSDCAWVQSNLRLCYSLNAKYDIHVHV